MILLDIEGTTTPIGFVSGTLFPYARTHLPHYLIDQGGTPECRRAMAKLREEYASDRERGEPVPDWTPLAYLEWLMDRDRKSPSLKRLQGEIWKAGFDTGELRSELFADVAPAFARWKESGIDIAIYSSGSVLAQKLIFAELLPLISAFFDTAVGAKRSVDSYKRIAASLRRAPETILFVSDVPEELNAALDAGCKILLAVRPGNRPVDGPEMLDEISSFDEIVA